MDIYSRYCLDFQVFDVLVYFISLLPGRVKVKLSF